MIVGINWRAAMLLTLTEILVETKNLQHKFQSTLNIDRPENRSPIRHQIYRENTAILIGVRQLNRIDRHRGDVQEQKIIAKRVKFSLRNWWELHLLRSTASGGVEVLSMESNHTPHHRYSGQMNRRMGDEGATRKHLFGSNYNAIPISIMIHCSWATGNER